MIYEKWYSFCKRLHVFIGDQFYKWACFVYNRPKLIIGLTLVIAFSLCTGFLRFNRFSQIERIFYPQNSKMFKDLDRSEKYFNYYKQNEEFLISYEEQEKSIFTKEIFEKVLEMHTHILNLQGFERFCVKNHYGNCSVIGPLEIFYYDDNNLVNLTSMLMKAYLNTSYLMENGVTAKLNYPQIFGELNINSTSMVMSSTILRIVYPVYFAKTRDQYDENSKWELRLLEYFSEMKSRLRENGILLIYNTVRSLDDSIERNTTDNILLISGSISAMVLFCAVAMTRIGSKIKSHFLISLFGIFCVMLGVGAGFGLALWSGQPYVGFVGVLPFLVLGVGIDDMFIIVNKLDHTDASMKGDHRLGLTMQHVGISVTMTTMTDLIAFIIGWISIFPAIRIFCLYAFLAIFFAYLLIVTLFLALLSYDMRRIDHNRIDCLPCWKGKMDGNAEAEEEFIRKKNNQDYSEKIMEKYGEILTRPVARGIIVTLAIIFLAVGCYGTSQTDLSFDYKIVGADGTEHVTWITTMENSFPFGNFPIDIVLDDPNVDYKDELVYHQFSELDKIAGENKYFMKQTVNWYSAFQQWSSHVNSTRGFYNKLNIFLNAFPDFKNDVIFETNGEIVASRMRLYTKFDLSWSFRSKAMKSLKEDLKLRTTLGFYPVSFSYIYATHLDVIMESTLSNVGICCGVILVITLPYVIHPFVSLMLLCTFLCFILELLGVMFFWSLSLNSITMIVMVMAIGFTVDYSCHITHAYLVSTAETPASRLIEAMRVMGSSVLKGGLSTLVGVIVLSLSSSKLFILFFKMMFSIICLGLLHGMVFLPVFLSIFCGSDRFRLEESDATGNKKHMSKEKNNDVENDPEAYLVTREKNGDVNGILVFDKVASV